MAKDRPNKIPTQKTIARHYSEGRYCDYPADIVLGAVNAFDYDYCPTAIPIQLGFKQMFVADFNAFVYLCNHKDNIDIDSFLSNPNGFMKNVGIELKVPLNDIIAHIMIALLDDDMLTALRSSDFMSVCRLIYSDDKESWSYRHPERYDRNFMRRDNYYNFTIAPCSLDKDDIKSAGFNDHIDINILHIADFFNASK